MIRNSPMASADTLRKPRASGDDPLAVDTWGLHPK